MENILSVAIFVLLGFLALKLLSAPIRWAAKLALNALSGFLGLWLVNLAAGFTGLTLPINLVTVLLSGILGIPGIILVALMELL